VAGSRFKQVISMTLEQIEQIKNLRQIKRLRVNDVARLVGVTSDQVIAVMRNSDGRNTEPDESQLIDGELIGDRIKRLTALIRSGRLRVEGRTGEVEYV
jgi:hypothetical protein